MTPFTPNPLTQIARAGVGLLAIYWGIVGLMQLAAAVTGALEFAVSVESIDVQRIAIGGGFALVGSILPAVFLFRGRDFIAYRLVRVNEPGPTLAITASEVLCVGSMLLAVSLGIESIVASLTLVGFGFAASALDSEARARLVELAVKPGAILVGQGIAAVALWRYARKLAARGIE